jgi:hypothetical protein
MPPELQPPAHYFLTTAPDRIVILDLEIHVMQAAASLTQARSAEWKCSLYAIETSSLPF